MRLIKTNKDLINKNGEILAITISAICNDFSFCMRSLVTEFTLSCSKMAEIQVKLISELQKIFPVNFQGTGSLVETAIEVTIIGNEENQRPEFEEINEKFRNLLMSLRHLSDFYITFFDKLDNPSDQQSAYAFQLCLGVMDELNGQENLLKKVTAKEDVTNFIVRLIKFISQNPQMIHVQPELYNLLIIKIVEFLLNENLDVESFQFIEEHLVQQILYDDFWSSLICFQIFRDFILQLQTSSSIDKYFNFFCSLTTKTRNPMILDLLEFMIKLKPELVNATFIDSNLLRDLTRSLKSDDVERFNEAFASLQGDPDASGYHRLIKALKPLSFGAINQANNETFSNFIEVLKMTKNSCYQMFSHLIVSIMEVAIAIKDQKRKMSFLIKFIPFLVIETELPFEVEVKYLELLFSYLPLAKLNNLSKLLTKEFDKLLNYSPNKAIMRKIGQSHFEKNTNELKALDLKVFQFE